MKKGLGLKSDFLHWKCKLRAGGKAEMERVRVGVLRFARNKMEKPGKDGSFPRGSCGYFAEKVEQLDAEHPTCQFLWPQNSLRSNFTLTWNLWLSPDSNTHDPCWHEFLPKIVQNHRKSLHQMCTNMDSVMEHTPTYPII